MTVSIKEIQRRVTGLGGRINAPTSLLVVRSAPVDDGSPYVDTTEAGYDFVSAERGVEFSRRATGAGGLTDSPVPDLACRSPGYCAQLPIGGPANHVIREIYNVSPPVSNQPPVIDWSTRSPGVWGGR